MFPWSISQRADHPYLKTDNENAALSRFTSRGLELQPACAERDQSVGYRGVESRLPLRSFLRDGRSIVQSHDRVSGALTRAG